MTLPLRKITLLLAAVFILTACAAPTPAATVTTPATPTSQVSETAAPEPTESPTAAPGQMVWIHTANPQAAFQEQFAELAQAASLELVEQEALPAELASGVRLVVVENPAGEQFTALASANPEVQFLVLGSASVPAQGNVSTVGVERSHAAFIAGLIGQMVSPDFRGGALLPDTAPELADAFINGGRYLCGRCAPIYAPVVLFPVAELVQDPSRPENWTAAFATLDQNRLETLYLPTEGAGPDFGDLLASLQAAEVNLVGERRPEGIPDRNWIATIRVDPTGQLQQLIPALLSGHGGQQLNAPVVLEDVNQEVLSPGKLNAVQLAIEELASGYLHPFSVPLE